jgi:DNA-directed RNA polymerase subunit RPC12/RpoP
VLRGADGQTARRPAPPKRGAAESARPRVLRLDLSIISSPLSLVCKSCRKLFQKDLHIFGEDDLACPHCGNRYVVPGMTPESALVHECGAAVAALRAATLDSPLTLDVDLAFGFEHLVDYDLLPPSLRPDYHSRLEVILSHKIASREATPMMNELGHGSNEATSRPTSRADRGTRAGAGRAPPRTPGDASRPTSRGGA